MTKSKHIDKICIAVIAVMIVITVLFMFGGTFGLTTVARTVKYESTLFDTSYVHKIDIVMSDWDSFIESCENEEYSSCTVVVDGDKYTNIAIRAKGNTSLSSVKSLGSRRYSFKLEFDHYEDTKTLDGLDKLCLNNLIQDNTMMKDYLVYQMMNDFGVDSPLCSFAYITVNGEDWGLYLAVEGVEDSFLERNYGVNTGNLYKPDSTSLGGGRGNGKDFNENNTVITENNSENTTENNKQNNMTDNQEQNASLLPEFGDDQRGHFDPGTQGMMPPNDSGRPNNGFRPGEQAQNESDYNSDSQSDENSQHQDGFASNEDNKQGEMQKAGGMGSDDVKLKYIDDDADSYSNIFENAKTDISSADKKRLIDSLKKLSSYSDIEKVLDMDEVLRYFVVHNFVCNGDSYTGAMIHNYYLHEINGKLGMIPWDYNLAFGTFEGNNSSNAVNASIDNPVSGGDVDDRPMLGWIFSDDSYTEAYHELFSGFIEKWFENGRLEQVISDTADMIRPYVEKDPTKFCTTEEFEKGVTAISQFVSLRAQAVTLQLNGDNTAVKSDALNLSDMGTMGGGMSNRTSGESVPNGQNGDVPDNANILSMITLTDEDGNKVDISTVIKDVSSVAAVTLLDGTTVDISETDMRDIMKINFSKMISVTDKSGNTTDLSKYTVAAAAPGMPDKNNGIDNNNKSAGTTNQNSGSDRDREETDGSADEPTGSDGFSNETDTDGQGNRQPPNENNNRQGEMPQLSDKQPNGQESSSAITWIFIGVSFVALVIGLFIAAKKY